LKKTLLLLMLVFLSGALIAKTTWSKRNVHLEKIYKKVYKKSSICL